VTEVGRFFDGVSYSEADQAEVQARMVRDGVCFGVANQLAVTTSGGFANVNSGEAFVQGFWYKNTSIKAIPIPGNASATPRVDLVVLHLDRVLNSLIATLHVGVVGGGAPTLTQIAGSDWEILLATISTASNVSTVTDARQYQSNMYNPMTTQDDIVVADAHGNPVRRAKGGNNTVYGVNPAGVAGYYQINPMTALNDLSIGGTVVSGVATPTVLPKGPLNSILQVDHATSNLAWLASAANGVFATDTSGNIFWLVPGNNSVLRTSTSGAISSVSPTLNGTFLGAVSNNLAFRRVATTVYDFTAASDFWNGGTITAGTRTGFAGAFNFTKNYDDTDLLIFVRCQMFAVASSALEVMTSIDISTPSIGTVTRSLGSGSLNIAGGPANLFAGSGPVIAHGTAGACSMQVYVFTNGVNLSQVYCRAASFPSIEGFQISVMEIG
jgi:hypothetical protein